MGKPIKYNLTSAKGQALLTFQGRRLPENIEVFETELVEEIKQKSKTEKQSELNSDFRNLLIQSDCLSACAYLKSKNIKVDLVYIDPPFASGANYAKKIYLRTGKKEEIETEDNTIGEEIMYNDIWQKEDYLNWLYERLLSIRDVMSEKASIYVHLDWHIGHYVKVLMDEVFGEENLQREIIWRIGWVSGYKSVANNWVRNHDTILYYTKNAEERTFNKNYVPYPPGYERWGGRPSGQGLPIEDVWGVFPQEGVTSLQVVSFSKEDVNYTTQKPEGLLERIIKASSDNGMIVADFFIGSGTTAKVANDLGRKFIACDSGINAIQTTRDRLVKEKVEFDILKVKDGVRLFRNPAQTTAKVFSLINGFKTRKDLGLGEFWDGGIAGAKGEYIPVKFVGIHERLTKELLDVVLEEIYQLQDVANEVSTVQVIYAHKDPDIEQAYVNKEIKKAGKTNIKVDLVSLDNLLTNKRDVLIPPDNADVEIVKEKDGWKVEIKRYFSPYLKAKIDDYNAKKVRKPIQTTIDGDETEEQPVSSKPVAISETGLELIEAIQFDTKLRKDGVWESDLSLEDKASPKDKIKGIYKLNTNKFRLKIRNIAGDEIIIDNNDLQE
jgi:adenine-specific DNA-methyltransferase